MLLFAKIKSYFSSCTSISRFLLFSVICGARMKSDVRESFVIGSVAKSYGNLFLNAKTAIFDRRFNKKMNVQLENFPRAVVIAASDCCGSSLVYCNLILYPLSLPRFSNMMQAAALPDPCICPELIRDTGFVHGHYRVVGVRCDIPCVHTGDLKRK